MKDIAYYILTGVLALIAVIIVFRRPRGAAVEAALASRPWAYALIIDIVAIVALTLFRWGLLGVLFGGC